MTDHEPSRFGRVSIGALVENVNIKGSLNSGESNTRISALKLPNAPVLEPKLDEYKCRRGN